jgi:hypothetical protein
LSHLSAIFWLGIFQDRFGLASNLNSPDLHILSSKYYRPEPPARGINTIISVKPMLCPPDSPSPVCSGSVGSGVESVIRRLPKSLCPMEKNSWQDLGVYGVY